MVARNTVAPACRADLIMLRRLLTTPGIEAAPPTLMSLTPSSSSTACGNDVDSTPLKRTAPSVACSFGSPSLTIVNVCVAYRDDSCFESTSGYDSPGEALRSAQSRAVSATSASPVGGPPNGHDVAMTPAVMLSPKARKR